MYEAAVCRHCDRILTSSESLPQDTYMYCLDCSRGGKRSSLYKKIQVDDEDAIHIRTGRKFEHTDVEVVK